jgi:hypothetical protein
VHARAQREGEVGDRDVQVDEAVVVVGGPGAAGEERRERDRVERDRAVRDGMEGSLAVVVVEGVRSGVREEQVGEAVVVVVGPAGAVAVLVALAEPLSTTRV